MTREVETREVLLTYNNGKLLSSVDCAVGIVQALCPYDEVIYFGLLTTRLLSFLFYVRKVRHGGVKELETGSKRLTGESNPGCWRPRPGSGHLTTQPLVSTVFPLPPLKAPRSFRALIVPL